MAASQLVLCADNLANPVIYPGHTITADEEPAGFEAANVGDGRRDLSDRWQAGTANADHYVRIACDQPRAVNFFGLDRAGNHRGTRWQLIGADVDDVTKGTTDFDITIPTVPGGALAGPNGCLTTEGAWLILLPLDVHQYWFAVSKAMGAGLVPQVTGLWLGCAWQPAGPVHYPPLHDLNYRVDIQSARGPSGWEGRGRHQVARVGIVDVRMLDESNDDAFNFHVMSLYLRGRAMWSILRSLDNPERAFLSRASAGEHGSTFDPLTWLPGRVARIQLLEEQAVP